jgi:glycosyltransferase involved in cell wall biosynthesis
MKVTLLAWSRESGGAERQLVNLARGLHSRAHDVLVIVFFPNAYVEDLLRAAGTPFRVLGVRGRWDAARYLVRFLSQCVKRDHDVVYAFLQVPNLLTVPLRLFQKNTKLVWGIRSSSLNMQTTALGRLITGWERRLSGIADLVIANSYRGRSDAIASGFNPGSIRVIHNGIDTELFRPDPAGGAGIRSDLGIGDDTPVIGLVGRLAAKKDHATFLQAAKIILRKHPGLYFMCVGEAPEPARSRIESQARSLGLEHRLIWAGFQQNMPAVYGALSIVTLTSSRGEGFPNAIAEAMACGVPCVVTDVADTPIIVGELGWVVPPGDPQALADSWLEALAEKQDPEVQLSRRRRIEDNFSLDRMVDQTEEALTRLIGPGLESRKARGS